MDLSKVSNGDLADLHRGRSSARDRAKQELAEVELELDRRGIAEARGRTTLTTRCDGGWRSERAGLQASA